MNRFCVLVVMVVAVLGGPRWAEAQEAVGQVVAVGGAVTAARAGGGSDTLELDSPIYQGDAIRTASGAELGIRFVDGTTLTMGPDAAMVIDELVYSAGSNANSGLFSLTTGLFVLVSGDVARSGDLMVTTPVSTIGIRGTAVAIKAASEEIANIITLLRDPNGNEGIVEVANDVTRLVLSALGDTATLLRRNGPITASQLSAQDIANVFQAALAVMQRLTGDSLGAELVEDAEAAAALLEQLQLLIEENPSQDASPD